jgi:hypothetical protein
MNLIFLFNQNDAAKVLVTIQSGVTLAQKYVTLAQKMWIPLRILRALAEGCAPVFCR